MSNSVGDGALWDVACCGDTASVLRSYVLMDWSDVMSCASGLELWAAGARPFVWSYTGVVEAGVWAALSAVLSVLGEVGLA